MDEPFVRITTLYTQKDYDIALFLEEDGRQMTQVIAVALQLSPEETQLTAVPSHTVPARTVEKTASGLPTKKLRGSMLITVACLHMPWLELTDKLVKAIGVELCKRIRFMREEVDFQLCIKRDNHHGYFRHFSSPAP